MNTGKNAVSEWKISEAVYNEPRAYRVLHNGLMLLDKAGRVRKFATKQAAKDAIRTATNN